MKEGDFVEIEYIGRISQSNEIFDLTSEKLAKEKGIFNPRVKYGPVKVIIGSGMLLKPLDSKLNNIKTGEEKKIEIKKDDGFGDRNPKLTTIVPETSLRKQNITPVPGQFITFGNRQGKIIAANSGRVRIDFNHPLAGKDLVYTIKILRKIEDTKEMVETICEKVIKIKPNIQISNQKAIIKMQIKLPDEYKTELNEEIIKYIKDIKKVSIENPEEPKKTTNKKVQ